MLDMLEKEISRLNLFFGNMPEIVTAIADSIPSQNIPQRMKIALAISEIMLFTSQFRINIRHWNNSIIPINSITFCIAKSGAAKDSSLKAARKCFSKGYNVIHKFRQCSAINKAIKKAIEAGVENPKQFSGYKDFYTPPSPLFVAISTTEGFIQHLNDLSDDVLGSGFITSSELGAELSSNINLVDNIKLISELYDEGNKEVKVLKARENQNREIKSLPVSALFMGSQDNLLFNEAIKQKFKTEFTTKLARRSFFVFVHEDIPPVEYSSVDELLKQERLLEDKSITNRNDVDEYCEYIAKKLISRKDTTITVSEEVRDLFLLYRKYNEAVANTIDSRFPITKLTRMHLQWKALKLSGALALMQEYDKIELPCYKAAVEFVELIGNDILVFEKELTKEPYELFVSYAHTYAINGTFTMKLHSLRKAGFISNKGLSSTQLSELCKLVNSYDDYGSYAVKDDTITFQEIKKTGKILLSYIPCTGTKESRKSKCDTGYTCEELTFSDLEDMLQGDYAYTPFKFRNGVRSKDNIISGCKWIVLDVDDSEITDTEAHLLLSDINHYVVRTSDKNNANKYRVLLELDTEVDIPDIKWLIFTGAIAKDLGIYRDPLAKSQILFSYSDRDILKVTDQEPLVTKPYLHLVDNYKPSIDKIPGKKVCKTMLDDPMTTFEKAYNAPDGSGRRRLIWACRRARELGASRDYCKNLLDNITRYWVKGFPEKDLEIMKNQLNRWTFNEN